MFTIPNNTQAGITSNPQSLVFQTDIDSIVQGVSGVGVLTGCAVTAQGAPNMTVAVASGTTTPDGSSSVSVTSGNLTISAAHATLGRLDLISVNATGVKAVTTGTAATNPSMPALPASSILLAAVFVPAAATTITTIRIVDKRVFTSLVAAAGTLTGTTLAANVVTTSITAVGTIVTGVWNGTVVSVAYGGTGVATRTAYTVSLAGTTSTGAHQEVSGVGTAGQILTSNGAAAIPSWQESTGKTATYTATLSDVENTGSETTALTFSIPANSMADGDLITVVPAGLGKNNKGSAGTGLFKVNVGAGSQVDIFLNSGTPLAFADSATEYPIGPSFWLQRRGSTVLVGNGLGPAGANSAASLTLTSLTANIGGTSTPTNFTGANTVTLKVTLSAAHATFYYRLLTGGSVIVIHTKN